MNKKEITVASVNSEYISDLLKDKDALHLSLLAKIMELHRFSLAEKKGGE